MIMINDGFYLYSQMSDEAICEYFQSSYGDINWISMYTIPKYRFAILKFRLATSVRKASDRKQHTIAGSIVNVSIAEQMNRKRFGLLSLNDKLIIGVLQHLDWKDLWSVANTQSQRLKKLTERTFASMYEDRVLCMSESDSTIEDCLRTFGPHIRSLRLSPPLRMGPHNGAQILYLVQNHCTSLISLELERFICSHNAHASADDLIPLFTRLQIFKLAHSAISFGLLKILHLVPELTLIHLRGQYFHVNFPFRPIHERRLSHMKTLRIVDYIRDESWGQVAFMNNIQSDTLEYLELESHLWDGPAPAESPIASFQNLKTLKLYGLEFAMGFRDFYPLIRELTRLSEFIYGYAERLKIEQLFNVVRTGESLQKFIVIFKHRANKRWKTIRQNNMRTFKNTLDIVSQRPNGKPLNAIFVGNESQITRFNVAFPPDAPLKFTCLSMESVAQVLEVGNNYTDIKMSDGQIAKLRRQGFIL